MELLYEAFNESAGFLTWAIYGALSGYITLAINTKKEPMPKYVFVIRIMVFIIFGLIFTVNILAIADIFENKLGRFAQVIIYILATTMVIVNSYPIIKPLVDANKQNKRPDKNVESHH